MTPRRQPQRQGYRYQCFICGLDTDDSDKAIGHVARWHTSTGYTTLPSFDKPFYKTEAEKRAERWLQT